VFSNGERKTGPDASLYLHDLRRKKYEVERLYPNIETHYRTMHDAFPKELWEGKTWWDIYTDGK
jgi:hypothetical protein